jgi:hypothetical protein
VGEALEAPIPASSTWLAMYMPFGNKKKERNEEQDLSLSHNVHLPKSPELLCPHTSARRHPGDAQR